MCYDPNEEHKPRVFTVIELCNHVGALHHDVYQSFIENLESHLQSNRCDKDGRRIDSPPHLDIDSIKRGILHEVRKTEIIATTKSDLGTKDAKSVEKILINYIQQLLSNTPSWTGTMGELYAPIGLDVDNPRLPKTPRILNKILNTMKEELLTHNIRFLRLSHGHVILQRKINGAFEPIGTDYKVIKTPMDTKNGETELRKTFGSSEKYWEDNIIDSIKRLLSDRLLWIGTQRELYSTLKHGVGGIDFPPTSSQLYILIIGYTERLLRIGIQVSSPKRTAFSDKERTVILQRKVDGKFEPLNLELLSRTIRTTLESEFRDGLSLDELSCKLHDLTGGGYCLNGGEIEVYMERHNILRAKTELRKTIEEPAHTTVTESDNAKTTSDVAHTDTKLSYQAGYNKSTELDALPKDVRERFESYFRLGRSVTTILKYINNITHGEPQISTTTLRAYMERHHITRQKTSDRVLKWEHQKEKPDKMAEVVINGIQQLLKDTPSWIGTPTELHSKIRTDSTFFPKSPSRMGYIINSVKERLLNNDIQFSRHPRSSLSKTLYGLFRDSRSSVIIALQRKVDGKFKSFEELVANLTPPTPDHIVEVACETIPDARISAPLVKIHPIEVIGLSMLKQSMVEIPSEVVSRIGVKDGDRVIFIDDGENIIIKPAKYIT